MISYRLLFIISLSAVAFAILGLLRLDIDTDLVRSLPADERVIADAIDIFEHHPIHDQIAVDVMLNVVNPDTLVEIGGFLENKMEESGLFSQVGIDSTSVLIPDLAIHIARNLPLLFSLDELNEKVAPLLEDELINERILSLYEDLSSIEGIGQVDFIGLDPLGLKDIVLAKMAPLKPSTNTRFYLNNLLSADGHHLLVTARPHTSGTDTVSARDIDELLNSSSKEISAKYAPSGLEVTLTPVGAYRAALDNERIIRHDVQLALILATAGIGILLLFAFPRPLIGLLSLLPALAGVGVAIFVYSLLHSSISIMVLGFGGAVISITVDHGIAYLLFLDRSSETKGKDASVEVRAIGIMAVITSVGAFLILSFSGFPIFAQLGQFTALGILFSFLFVHSVFPQIFPTMPPGSNRVLPLHNLVNALYSTGKTGALMAIILATGLLFFAKPQFYTSLSSMNTVSEETIAADEMFNEVWGDSGKAIYLMTTADTMSRLQSNNDLILAKIEHDIDTDMLSPGFVPSMVFPGKERGLQNLAAWHDFWHSRVGKVQRTLLAAGTSLGFTNEAFAGFFSMLEPTYNIQPQPIPTKFYNLLGISKNEDESRLVQFITVRPDSNYNADVLFSRYGKETKIFDVSTFTSRLAEILVSTFTTMLAIITVSAALLLFLFYLNLWLTIFTLLPPLFAYICTLGTLKLIGQPLDIPALMLSIVVFGMGIDYSIFCVRAHQRYRSTRHPSFVLVRVAVFMAGASSLIGFGVLCLAEHTLLKSIGVTSLLGIGYSLVGTFMLLPPLMKYYQEREDLKVNSANATINQCIRARYSKLEAYSRMFVRFKLRFDPMFDDLLKMVGRKKDVTTIIDIGCGYGVPACWCLENFENAHIFGIDPDLERVRVAAIATGNRGTITAGRAPAMPNEPDDADIVLIIDMLHYLDDETVANLFKNSFQTLGNSGLLVIRMVNRPAGTPSWSWRLEDIRVKLSAQQAYYRSSEQMAECMRNAGFVIDIDQVTPQNEELFWIVGRAEKEPTIVRR